MAESKELLDNAAFIRTHTDTYQLISPLRINDQIQLHTVRLEKKVTHFEKEAWKKAITFLRRASF